MNRRIQVNVIVSLLISLCWEADPTYGGKQAIIPFEPNIRLPGLETAPPRHVDFFFAGRRLLEEFGQAEQCDVPFHGVFTRADSGSAGSVTQVGIAGEEQRPMRYGPAKSRWQARFSGREAARGACFNRSIKTSSRLGTNAAGPGPAVPDRWSNRRCVDFLSFFVEMPGGNLDRLLALHLCHTAGRRLRASDGPVAGIACALREPRHSPRKHRKYDGLGRPGGGLRGAPKSIGARYAERRSGDQPEGRRHEVNPISVSTNQSSRLNLQPSPGR